MNSTDFKDYLLERPSMREYAAGCADSAAAWAGCDAGHMLAAYVASVASDAPGDPARIVLQTVLSRRALPLLVLHYDDPFVKTAVDAVRAFAAGEIDSAQMHHVTLNAYGGALRDTADLATYQRRMLAAHLCEFAEWSPLDPYRREVLASALAVDCDRYGVADDLHALLQNPPRREISP